MEGYILKYLNDEDNESFEVDAVKVASNLVQITGDYPIRTDGFLLSRKGIDDNWDYTKYTTIYKEIVDGVIFSNDGSVEPEPNENPVFIEEEGE